MKVTKHGIWWNDKQSSTHLIPFHLDFFKGIGQLIKYILRSK